MEKIEKMTVNAGGEGVTYNEEEHIIKALNTVESGTTLTLETVGDGYITHTDICIDDISINAIRVIGGEIFYDPAE